MSSAPTVTPPRLTAAGLLERLRQRGIHLSLVDGRLAYDAPPDVLTDQVVATIRQAKPALVKLLAAQAPDPATAELVETVGVLNGYWQRHADKWTDKQYQTRKAVLLHRANELDAALKRTGHRLEDCGWTLSPDAQWHRIGEPAPQKRVIPTDETVEGELNDRLAF